MLDIGIAITLLVALVRAIRMKHLVSCGLIIVAYLLVMDAWNALVARPEADHPLRGFAVLFLGPSAIMERAHGALPTIDLFVTYPVLVRIAIILISVGAFVFLRRESAPLRPETTRARLLDSIALPLVFVPIAEVVTIAIAVLTVWLARER